MQVAGNNPELVFFYFYWCAHSVQIILFKAVKEGQFLELSTLAWPSVSRLGSSEGHLWGKRKKPGEGISSLQGASHKR
jgi:hypothetical protein